MTANDKIIPAISFTTAGTGVSAKADELGMRPMQARAFEKRGEQYLLIESPPASGKSRALMFVALNKLTNQGVRQAIICVPERSIGASFGSEPLSKWGFYADWVGRAAFLLRPVHVRLLDELKTSAKLFADETTLPVLDPGRGRTKTGQLWAYARDDRPWGGVDPPGVAYIYAPDRKAEQPIKHLARFKGVLQVDGYGGYRPLAEKGEVKLAFCWAHVRRPFYELAAAGPAPIATEILQRIKALYAVEAEIRGMTADQRRAARQDRSRPLLEAMEPWLRTKLQTVSQKGKLADAIRYALARWEGLTRFVCDGTIEIDSNTVERSIRPIALTRKNALFAGSDGGAEHWAAIASLVETCKLNGIDPEAYLADTITRIVQGHPQSRLGELLPWIYKAGVA